MFTVLSKTRNSNLFLLGGLVIGVMTVLTFAMVPAISAPRSTHTALTGNVEVTSDYFQRHPELKISVAGDDVNGDFALRRAEWDVQTAAIPVTGISIASDYYERHPELHLSIANAADMSDYFTRHSQLLVPTIDSSDYFLRH